MAKRASKRTPKLPGNLEGFVDGDEQLLLAEDKWAVVRFEDEGRIYAVVPITDVRSICPDDDDTDFENGDYVDAIWPGDGKLYEAVFLDCGTKQEMRLLRSRLEKEVKAKTKGKITATTTNKEKAAEEKKRAAEEKKKAEEEKKKAEEEKKKAAEEKKKAAEEKKKAEEEKKKAEEEKKKAAKRKPEEDREAKEKAKLEAKRRREEAKQKRAAELNQAKQNAAYFKSTMINVSDEEFDEEERSEEPLIINNLPAIYSDPEDQDDSKCDNCLILQEKIKELEATLAEVRQELQDTKQRTSELSGACSGTTKGKPGVMTPQEAAKLGMVPLVAGSRVFLYQEQKNACYEAQPTRLCRNLVRVFFDFETLKKSNYAGGGKKGRPALNGTITEAIIGYCTDPQIIKHGKLESASRIAETIGKCCAEARRGISKTVDSI